MDSHWRSRSLYKTGEVKFKNCYLLNDHDEIRLLRIDVKPLLHYWVN